MDIIVDKARIALEDAQRSFAATIQAKARVDEKRGESISGADAEEKSLLLNQAIDQLKKSADRTESAGKRSLAAAKQADAMYAEIYI